MIINTRKGRMLILSVWVLGWMNFLPLSAQENGLDLLHQAQDAFYADDYKLATKLIKQARKADFGFCGNAWAEAENKLLYMEARILEDKGKEEKALAKLEGMNDMLAKAGDEGLRGRLLEETYTFYGVKDLIMRGWHKEKRRNPGISLLDYFDWETGYLSIPVDSAVTSRPVKFRINIIELQEIREAEADGKDFPFQEWVRRQDSFEY